MGNVSLCDPYVWEDPRYLFRFTWKHANSPNEHGVCASELVNEIVVIYILSILAGAVLASFTKLSISYMITGFLATIYLYPIFMKLKNIEAFRTQFMGAGSITTPSDEEGFPTKNSKILPGMDNKQQNEGSLAEGSLAEGFVVKQPVPDFNEIGVVGAPANPFNNVLIHEIQYAPTRDEAPDITTTDAKIKIDDFFRVQWYSDPTDVFGKSQSQREFITQPSTTIPNDQKSYQDWLYKIPGKTCKEGNPEACYGGTNGAALPWLNL